MFQQFFTPTYVNNVEIKTFGNVKEGDVVVLRFFYGEPGHNVSPPMLVGGVIMSRLVAKEVLKKFLAFMSVQDEHGKEPNIENV